MTSPGPATVHLNLNAKNNGSNPLRGKRVAAVVFAHYPYDPRPRRAAEALAQAGMRVDVICLRQNGESSKEIINGVNIRRVPLTRHRGGKFTYMAQYLAFILISFLLLAKRSLTRPYALVHVHNMPDVLVFSALIPKLLGAKVLLDLHDPMPELMMTIFDLDRQSAAVRLFYMLETWSIRFSDQVLTVNRACRRMFAGRSCSAEKVSIVMNAPDEGIFHYHPRRINGSVQRRPTDRFAIMYHGSLVERHGLDVAIQALEKVKLAVPGAELAIYGHPTPFLDKVMNRVKGTPIENSVHYYGPRRLEQIVAAIHECDLGIIPNRRSIFTEINTPTRIFEYLSQGKPVVAPDAPGIRDYFGSEDLIYFQLGDADSLARQIQFVFFHSEEAAKILRRGQEVYLSHTWSAERSRFLSVVEGLLQPEQQWATSIPKRQVIGLADE